MINILNIASYIPPGRINNLERLEELGATRDLIENKIGVNSISRMAKNQETSDMCVSAFESLAKKTGIKPEDVECMILVTQNPDARGLPHTTAIIQDKIGVPNRCAMFDVSQGCAGYIYGLSITTSFMTANFMRRGVLFTCDPYSKIVDTNDKNTALLFGDAATATLLGAPNNDSVSWVPSDFRFLSMGKDRDSLENRDGTFHMKGRAVFNFAAKQVVREIKTLLNDLKFTPAEIDLFFLHQGSKFIVDTIANRLGISADRVPSNISETGNTVSSSIPLMLLNFLERERPSRYLLSGFGVGLSVSTCILSNTSHDGE